MEIINHLFDKVILKNGNKYAYCLDTDDPCEANWMSKDELVSSYGLTDKFVDKVSEGWIAAYDTKSHQVIGFFPTIRAIPPLVSRLSKSDTSAINRQLNQEHIQVKGFLFCRLKKSGSHIASLKWAMQILESRILRFLIHNAYSSNKKFSVSVTKELIDLLR